MKYVNCIVVFNQYKDKALFCKRVKDPYKGLYNFVGGKVELGESSSAAAYRELQEETGIGRADICLFRLMDLTYYAQDFVLEIYVGQLQRDVRLVKEINPLEWLSLTEDFADAKRFAGDQNIAHIINVARKYPMDKNMECDYRYEELDELDKQKALNQLMSKLIEAEISICEDGTKSADDLETELGV